jgi:hypothetical protein
MRTLKISTDFSIYPGARYETDGKYSGEEFYKLKLKRAFQDALENNDQLIVDLDGTAGYASSFLSESFGLLTETFGKDQVLGRLQIVSDNEPDWKKVILEDYIPNASLRKKKPFAHA